MIDLLNITSPYDFGYELSKAYKGHVSVNISSQSGSVYISIGEDSLDVRISDHYSRSCTTKFDCESTGSEFVDVRIENFNDCGIKERMIEEAAKAKAEWDAE